MWPETCQNNDVDVAAPERQHKHPKDTFLKLCSQENWQIVKLWQENGCCIPLKKDLLALRIMCKMTLTAVYLWHSSSPSDVVNVCVTHPGSKWLRAGETLDSWRFNFFDIDLKNKIHISDTSLSSTLNNSTEQIQEHVCQAAYSAVYYIFFYHKNILLLIFLLCNYTKRCVVTKC